MYAQITVDLKDAVLLSNLSTQLSDHYKKSASDPVPILQELGLTDYLNQVAGAFSNPDAKVLYLLFAEDEVLIYVVGRTVAQIKIQCARTVKRVRKISGLNVKSVEAKIFFKTDDLDVPVLSGKEVRWFQSFWTSLVEKWFAKVFAGVFNFAGVFWYVSVALNSPSSSGATGSSQIGPVASASSISPITSAVIGLLATVVSVFFEAAYSTWRSNLWKWSESQ